LPFLQPPGAWPRPPHIWPTTCCPACRCVLSLPRRLRYHLEHDPKALNSALRRTSTRLSTACAVAAGPKVRAGAIAFIHRFGSALNRHIHFHVIVIDGVFELDPEHGVHFTEVPPLDADDAEAVQVEVRRRILRAYQRRGLLDKDDRKEMEHWDHGGGFSLDASVRVGAHDRRGLERLLRYKGISLAKKAMKAIENRLHRNPDLPKWDILIRPRVSW